MSKFTQSDFIMLPVPLSMFTAVCALIGGASLTQVADFHTQELPKGSAPVSQDTTKPSGTSEIAAQASQESDGIGATATTLASPSDGGEVDAHGHPWNAELHAATKGKTKDGLWRMKVGVVRPDPVAGFTAAPTTSTTEAGTESAQATSAPTEAAAPTATSTDEDDEFAAFRDAAANAAATDDAAKASVPARKWTDADLGALCNQAAVKLGDPTPVKELIAKFIPEGEVAHSRNIPEENRADFAKAVEAKAEIEFAG